MGATGKLNKLIAETEDLLEEISAERGAEIEALRDRLTQSIQRTKAALGDAPGERHNGNSPQHLKVRHVAASVNDYVKSYPWLALATGVLVASTIGILATSATKRSYAAH
jgi:ElaB/YqjD/DUF883 family membrane-anchored ribosome-binding protein